ncbi:MAG TPA: STAS domain-containing protein [Clostridiales bacterium]|nr:STAS domain-containing protein [Clostridiales bacterium]
MSEDLVIKNECLNDKVIVILSGEADIYTSSQLKDKLYELIDKNKTDIIIDCNELSYIDSTGLGVFAGALKKAGQYNKSIYIRGLKSNIKKLFTITGLDRLFIIEE